MQTPIIVVENYSQEWEHAFLRLEGVFRATLENLILDVQHVGSTSVPGLAAKPILDIDLVIENRSQLPEVISKLQSLGYTHLGDLGIKEREAFKRLSDDVPQDGSGTRWMLHHLYVCPRGSVSLKNHLALRDYLRKNKDAAEQYAALKRKLAAQYPNDIDSYVEGKTGFITAVLERCGFAGDDLKDIELQNKKPGA